MHVRNYPLAARLLMRVVFDIVRSNRIVARLIRRGDGGVRSGFVAIPLTLTSHHGLAVLGCIITSTPGTIWVSYDPIGNMLLIHVLDLVDEQAWIDTIQQRYQRSSEERRVGQGGVGRYNLRGVAAADTKHGRQNKN